MADRPIAPVQPVSKIKPLRKLWLPKKPTLKMLSKCKQALKNSKGPRLSD